MSDLLKEYLSWNFENNEFYMELKEHEAFLYDRFMPLFEVLDNIYQTATFDETGLSDDMEKIFSVGLEYLHDQMSTCKLYLEKTFKNDMHRFLEYDEMICSVLYIDDVRYELVENKMTIDENLLDDLLEEAEAIIQGQKKVPKGFQVYVDDKLKTIIGEHKFEFYGIIDIFIDIAETLGVYLYEEKEITLGKDV